MTTHTNSEVELKLDPVNTIATAPARAKVRNHLPREALSRLIPLAEKVIGPLASVDAACRVSDRNPDSIWLLFSGENERPEGFQAWLILNEDGRDRLLSGTLNLNDPDPDCICTQDQKPALLYIWASYAPGRTAAAIKIIEEHFSSPRYADIDVVSWAVGIRGERAMARQKFTKGVVWHGKNLPHFWILKRSAGAIAASLPRYDRHRKGRMPTGIEVVHGMDDFLKIAAIRAAVYIGEQSCPFSEEFDGNDFAATHLLAYIDDEPAGCMRIRFFGDFAKLERLAVRKEYRRSSIALNLVRAAIDLCREKGYRTLYGHAKTDLTSFWARFGFRIKGNGATFRFSDHNYVEMVNEVTPSDQALSLVTEPHILIRPEGQWHEPGVLDRSSERGAADGAGR